MYRMRKKSKNCFWYQKPSNLLKVQITYNAIVCSFQYGNQKNQLSRVWFYQMLWLLHQLVPCSNEHYVKKVQSTVLVPKTFQFIASNAFFVGSISTGTTTLVAGSVFLLNIMESSPKSPTQSKALFLVPKIFQFTACVNNLKPHCLFILEQEEDN